MHETRKAVFNFDAEEFMRQIEENPDYAERVCFKCLKSFKTTSTEKRVWCHSCEIEKMRWKMSG